MMTPIVASSSETQGESNVILFKNVDVFDGKSPHLLQNVHVLVKGNQIESVTDAEPFVPPNSKVIQVDGKGRVLMPGLIDNHYHTAFASGKMASFFTADPSLAYYHAAREAQALLMRGFTSIRDLAGGVYGLRQAIDQGILNGPRMWVSGASISQTGGHGDFRNINVSAVRFCPGPLPNPDSSAFTLESGKTHQPKESHFETLFDCIGLDPGYFLGPTP